VTLCTINYTETFAKSFDGVIEHLLFYNEQSVRTIEHTEQAILKVSEVVELQPEAYPMNQDILEYGLKYREANVKSGNDRFRILYSLVKTGNGVEINFELFLLQKMSITKALFQQLFTGH
jgi:hypothetical protein